MFMFLGFVLSNVSLTPLLYGVYGALALFYLVRRVNEVKEQTFVEGCLVRLKEENVKLLKENKELKQKHRAFGGRLKSLLRDYETLKGTLVAAYKDLAAKEVQIMDLKEKAKRLITVEKDRDRTIFFNRKLYDLFVGMKMNLQDMNHRLVMKEDERARAVQKNALLFHKLSSARQERDNALNNYALLEVENQRLSNRCSYWVQDAANTQRQLDNVKQQLVDERRENLSNSLYVNFLKGELQELRITYHEASDLRKTVEELTQNVLRSEMIVFSVDSILRDMIRTYQDDNEFYSFYNPLVGIRESIETYFYSVYQPPETEGV